MWAGVGLGKLNGSGKGSEGEWRGGRAVIMAMRRAGDSTQAEG